MLSIENLYWILYENLLEPVGLDCWHYYPFGTTNNFSGPGYFRPWTTTKLNNHVLFHFEQEPLFDMSLGHIVDQKHFFWSNKACKILANSEKSPLKKALCEERGMLDWYFFFHGLAALDWFRDSQFIDLEQTPIKIYGSLNHLVRHKRSYRMAVTARLFAKRLDQYGDISLHATRSDLVDEVNSVTTLLSYKDKSLIENQLISRDCWPLTLDQSVVDAKASAHFGPQEYKLWQNSFVHLVNETVFYDQKLHLTEKIFKPIVASRPFLLFAAPNNLAYLRSYGFKTFDSWWDESYDSVQDNDRRCDMIVDIIENLCSKSRAELARMHEQMKSVLHYNKQHFFGKFREIIVNEMIENFDACLRIWNNGRVDGRQVPRPENFNKARAVLLR